MAAAWRQQVRQQWNDGRGYQHFGGRGRPEVAVLYSRDARGRWLRVLAVVGVGGGLVWASGRQEVPYTLRSHSILVGPQAELDMGKQVYQQVWVCVCGGGLRLFVLMPGGSCQPIGCHTADLSALSAPAGLPAPPPSLRTPAAK